MDFYANLHLHSTHSDGPCTPREFNHVFNLLTAKGIEKTENYMNWFNKNFREQRGKYPPVSNFLPTDKLIALIKDAGGIAILAHPVAYGLDYLDELIGII